MKIIKVTGEMAKEIVQMALTAAQKARSNVMEALDDDADKLNQLFPELSRPLAPMRVAMAIQDRPDGNVSANDLNNLMYSIRTSSVGKLLFLFMWEQKWAKEFGKVDDIVERGMFMVDGALL